jgi:hypothetical protein
MKEEFLNIAKNTATVLPFIWMYYAPAHIVILFLLLIICWDTFLGIKASKKLGRKITSSRFNHLFAKIFSYTLFIGIGILIGNEFEIKSAYFFASLPAFYSELKSIDENQKTLGKKGIFSHFSETWKMILTVKKERDKLNRNDSGN